jgi:hypothetical protein
MQVTGEDFQIVYYDTPGVLRPNYKLQVQIHPYHSCPKCPSLYTECPIPGC